MDASRDSRRRSRPSIFDTDWMVLRSLARGINRQADCLAVAGKIVLDFGCGSQPYRSIFESRGAQYQAADLGNESDVSIGIDGLVDAPSAASDLVLSFQVLEHVRDLDTYLAEARRVLRPGGQLLLSTHGTWLYHPHPEDHRRWTRTGLINELETRGWKVEKCESIVGPLAWTTLIRLTGYCYLLRLIPFGGSLIGAVLCAIMNSRAVIEDSITPRKVKSDNGCIYLVRASRAGNFE